MAVQHHANDEYMLQVFTQGYWHDVRKVRKSGGANTCRSSAKNDGKPYRVINRSKGNAIYMEVK